MKKNAWIVDNFRIVEAIVESNIRTIDERDELLYRTYGMNPPIEVSNLDVNGSSDFEICRSLGNISGDIFADFRDDVDLARPVALFRLLTKLNSLFVLNNEESFNKFAYDVTYHYIKMYTSSYYKYLLNDGVQISNTKPRDRIVRKSIPMLYPDWHMVDRWNKVKSLPENDFQRKQVWWEFRDSYINKLNNIGFDRIRSELNENDVLLCYCSKECHRHILGEWLAQYNIHVTEL